MRPVHGEQSRGLLALKDESHPTRVYNTVLARGSSIKTGLTKEMSRVLLVVELIKLALSFLRDNRHVLIASFTL
jgi:hypothetical protein